ncbi:hypothetical protein MNB_SV-15-1594 [hydrothermal vent metagenome]|uniref:Lipoprotein n=1 Tax=hydrothermal vent metagenome TaxID=652676 RepID=A0A1W1EK16_9ZZZZ
MNKIYKITLIVFIFLVGCDNNPYYSEIKKSSIDGMGQTYLYVDSYPVSNIDYECGYLDMAKSGENGEFLYEFGSSCRFYLNDKELFSIDASSLKDGTIHTITNQSIIDKLYDADKNKNPNKIVI